MTATRILVVSEDECLRHLIGLNLRARGGEVQELPCPPDLLMGCPASTDLIVMDLGPDGEDTRGWEWVRALRATDWALHLPLVLLGTVWPTPAQVVALHPLSFVRKPFAVGTLLTALRDAQRGQADR